MFWMNAIVVAVAITLLHPVVDRHFSYITKMAKKKTTHILEGKGHE
jgi:hypothetical protein